METNINLQHLHESVRALCSMGWHLFPLIPSKKIPATPNGFKDAVSDPDEAISLFNNPEYNIGIATGPSDLVVLDVDGEEGSASLTSLLNGKQIPMTLKVSTRRGYHCYFNMPVGKRIGCSTSKIGKGLDIRGDGGYVVGPTSWVDTDEKGPAARYKIIDGSPVADAPDWLINAINQSTPVNIKLSKATDSPIRRIPDTPRQRAILNDLLMRTSADCEYDKWRNIVWGILSTGWSDAEQIALKWSESSPHRFDERAFYTLINSYEDCRYTGCIISLLKRYAGGAK